MLLKSDKPSYIQYIDEDRTGWYFTVVSQGGEIGLITAHDLKTGEVIELGSRLKKCIFVKPEEYLSMIEELEALKAYPPLNDSTYQAGYSRGIEDALQLVAQRANPQPGIE